MQRVYEEFQNIAAFRIVYISEAHATDDPLPTLFAEEKNIFEHKNYSERCTTAEMMMEEQSISIPCIIDGMDNRVSQDYKALPDRIYVVRKDGRLAIAASHGPEGFKPALDQTRVWLTAYRETGEEPEAIR